MFWIALLPNPWPAQAPSPPREGEPDPPPGRPKADQPPRGGANHTQWGAWGPVHTLAWQALRFSPRVALLEEAVLLEAQASLRLWGGKRRLLQELEHLGEEPPDGMQAAPIHPAPAHTHLILASAPTALAALALARHVHGQPERRRHLHTTQLQAGLDALPLHTLSAAAQHAPTLARLGCRSLGDVRALPRGGLQRRFGAALLDALDQAYGSKPESHVWITLPETFAQRVELPMHTESADTLLFAAKRMLQALQAWLAARQSGIRSFELQWLYEHRVRDEAAGGALTIATAQTSRDLAHWLRLLAEHLARQSLAAPVCELRLHVAQTEALAPSNASWLPDPTQERSSLLHFLERMEARLGAANVLAPQPLSDHRAERQALWQSAVPMHAGASAKKAPDRPWAKHCGPCWLLGQALALPLDARARPLYQGALKLLAGPERIEAGWWDCPPQDTQDRAHPSEITSNHGPALRDYFLAQSKHAGLLWIYRERKPEPGATQWFLHGIYG